MTGAPYAPFMEPRTTRPPGLSPLEPAAWIVRDPDFAAQMAERDALVLAGAPDVLAAEPGAEAAVAELAEALLDDLAARDGWRVEPDAVTRPDGVAVSRAGDALALIARAVQEDMLLLAAAPDGYRLIAGALCFPSRWSLTEKLGRPLTSIHRPVPHYAERLAARVDRVFAALAVERPVMRINWLATPTPTLRLVQREGEKRAPAPLSGGFWLRTERQTLRRLPRTGAIVFGIKTTLTPFAELTPPQAAALGAALADWDAAEIAYRGGAAQHAAALAALGVSRAA